MQGLDVIHSCGLVHGDVKPDNLRASVQPNGTQIRVVVTDLGTSCEPGLGGKQHSSNR